VRLADVRADSDRKEKQMNLYFEQDESFNEVERFKCLSVSLSLKLLNIDRLELRKIFVEDCASLSHLLVRIRCIIGFKFCFCCKEKFHL
jgi:hypothetical protein